MIRLFEMGYWCWEYWIYILRVGNDMRCREERKERKREMGTGKSFIFELGFLQGNHDSKKWKALPVYHLYFHLIHTIPLSLAVKSEDLHMKVYSQPRGHIEV